MYPSAARLSSLKTRQLSASLSRRAWLYREHKKFKSLTNRTTRFLPCQIVFLTAHNLHLLLEGEIGEVSGFLKPKVLHIIR